MLYPRSFVILSRYSTQQGKEILCTCLCGALCVFGNSDKPFVSRFSKAQQLLSLKQTLQLVFSWNCTKLIPSWLDEKNKQGFHNRFCAGDPDNTVVFVIDNDKREN